MMDYTKRPQNQGSRSVSQAVDTGYDVGLRAYMLRVYNYMAGGLALTGAIAWFVASSPALVQMLFSGPQAYVVMLAPMFFSFFMAFKLHTLSDSAAQGLFWGFCAVMGLSMASILLVFTGQSVARTFFICAGMFGGLSLYGYTTKRDLTGMGSIMVMGFWGIFLASIVNMFMQSSGLQFAIACIGVIVFSGITAYSTQQIKQVYYVLGGAQLNKAAVMGAYTLYITFINMFTMLLQLLGDRR